METEVRIDYRFQPLNRNRSRTTRTIGSQDFPVARAPKPSHFDESGTARMVDVGLKNETARSATAAGSVVLSRNAFAALAAGTSKKGDVLAVARVAGIQAGKRTSEWIPLCHSVPLTSLDVDFVLHEKASRVDVLATARCIARTGVEMEALTAVSAAALTVYDMLKAVDRGIRIENIRLIHKAGGKSGEYRAS
jgi:cyclic pyranopterin monophosphate synthase